MVKNTVVDRVTAAFIYFDKIDLTKCIIMKVYKSLYSIKQTDEVCSTVKRVTRNKIFVSSIWMR